MLPKVVLVSLLSLVLVYSAAGLECKIYVSSSDGINNTSCWTGGVQTPCATIDLAIQGTPTLQYNCSSGILINLSPGTYTLDTTSLLEQQVLRNNVSIIGMRDGSRYREVSITCLHVSSSSYNWLRYIVFQCVSLYNCNNVPVTCTEPSFDLTTHNEPMLGNEACPNYKLLLYNFDTSLQCSDYYLYNCQCDYLSFYADIIDACTYYENDWIYGLNVCISINSSRNDCSQLDLYNNWYQVNKCFDDYIGAGPIEVSLYIQTLKLINISTTKNITVTTKCVSGYDFDNRTGTCTLNTYHPQYNNNCVHGNAYYSRCSTMDYCYHCAMLQSDNCSTSKGVPMNNLYVCAECHDYGLLTFITIEIVPITVMVLLIIIFNIQLTNGSINGVVFYAQTIAINYSVYYYYYSSYNEFLELTEIPCNIFNLDFTQFIYNYFMCITPNVSPLGAISFWYVIGFYPLLLLLLLYVWITLYDKGYKCVVLVTRPFHRCMARFWSMTGIEPSFTHSIASIYILCFTQLTATSFRILSFNMWQTSLTFYYDVTQRYFQGWHGLAGFIAIIVLLFLIILPTLCILFYPFKWFQKLLDCLHLRKPLLITLADVFTGPYKNGTENTFDYRFMAGLYLMAKIIILSQFILIQFFFFWILILQACCSFLIAVIIIIFRPFQKNIHNFTEFLIMSVIMVISSVAFLLIWSSDFYANYIFVIPIINCLIFLVIIPSYLAYQVLTIEQACRHYHKRNNPAANRNQEDYQPLVGNDDDWVADRMENPQEYDEQHVPGRMYDASQEDHEPVTIATAAATYGSTNKTTIN